MNDATYKKIELVGTSEVSYEAAVQNAVNQAAQTLRHLRWFEVTETRGSIEDGKVQQWQVTVKISFRLEDD